MVTYLGWRGRRQNVDNVSEGEVIKTVIQPLPLPKKNATLFCIFFWLIKHHLQSKFIISKEMLQIMKKSSFGRCSRDRTAWVLIACFTFYMSLLDWMSDRYEGNLNQTPWQSNFLYLLSSLIFIFIFLRVLFLQKTGYVCYRLLWRVYVHPQWSKQLKKNTLTRIYRSVLAFKC